MLYRLTQPAFIDGGYYQGGSVIEIADESKVPTQAVRFRAGSALDQGLHTDVSLAEPVPVWSDRAYAINEVAIYNGEPWVSLQNGNTNQTPGVGSPYWVKAGTVPAPIPGAPFNAGPTVVPGYPPANRVPAPAIPGDVLDAEQRGQYPSDVGEPWSSATTYQTNAKVSYNGASWTSLQNGNTNQAPAVGSAFWLNSARPNEAPNSAFSAAQRDRGPVR